MQFEIPVLSLYQYVWQFMVEQSEAEGKEPEFINWFTPELWNHFLRYSDYKNEFFM